MCLKTFTFYNVIRCEIYFSLIFNVKENNSDNIDNESFNFFTFIKKKPFPKFSTQYGRFNGATQKIVTDFYAEMLYVRIN